ncbi:MAG: nuclear transport factor 2 family protein [Bacteroidetes bacterium]|nr:nuclear transport factor 2 family protein [Bacteroidota bacterium]
MKSKIFFGGLLVAIVILSFACNQKKDTTNAVSAVNKEQVKAEIQALENHFALIYNTRNADSLTYYADDAVSYFVGQKPVVGKAAIHKFIENELMDFPKGAKISFETIEIRVANDGQYVFEVGKYKQVDSMGTVLSGGHYFSLFEKRDGKYYCVRDMANSSPIDN